MQGHELEKFKKILLNKKKLILENNRTHLTRMDSMRENTLGDEADISALSISNLLDSSIFKQHNEDLKYIDSALEKIENGNYGICEMCDEPISLQRLKAKPHARYCIDCREHIEKSQKKETR